MPLPCKRALDQGHAQFDLASFDSLEIGVLTTARYFFLSFAQPESNGWLTAMLSAEILLQRPDSAVLVRQILIVVQEMRKARRSTFRFSNPRCRNCSEILTGDERHLIGMIRAARQLDKSRAFSSAMLLCEGNDVSNLMIAVQALATSMRAPAG